MYIPTYIHICALCRIHTYINVCMLGIYEHIQYLNIFIHMRISVLSLQVPHNASQAAALSPSPLHLQNAQAIKRAHATFGRTLLLFRTYVAHNFRSRNEPQRVCNLKIDDNI